MGAISKLRMLANEIDWNVYDNGGIQYDLRKIADEMEAENAKLRELLRKYSEYTSQDHCEGCFCKSRCNDGDVDECWQLTEIRGLAREMGVEVTDS